MADYAVAFTNTKTENVDHSPQPHAASPTHSLPDSFASYRSRVQQHGPMGGNKDKPVAASSSSSSSSSSIHPSLSYGPIGGTPARRLGSIQPKDGEYFDRSDLPKRFARLQWSDEEMEAITSAGASMWK